jgi:hypothetical protein
MKLTLVFLTLVCFSTRCTAFLLPSATALRIVDVKGRLSGFYATDRDENETKTNSGPESFQEKVDAFLDTPFFDPKNKDNGPFLKWFADLVESDYELAETFYVGLLFVILVIGAQELLRMQLYGASYIPFHLGSSKLW